MISKHLLNRKAVKAFALKVSKEKRAGKFLRVSNEFLENAQTFVDVRIRALTKSESQGGVTCEDKLLNRKAVMEKIEPLLQEALRSYLEAVVCHHPSLGKTLK